MKKIILATLILSAIACFAGVTKAHASPSCSVSNWSKPAIASGNVVASVSTSCTVNFRVDTFLEYFGTDGSWHGAHTATNALEWFLPNDGCGSANKFTHDDAPSLGLFYNNVGCQSGDGDNTLKKGRPTNKYNGGPLGDLCQYPWREHLEMYDGASPAGPLGWIFNSGTTAATC